MGKDARASRLSSQQSAISSQQSAISNQQSIFSQHCRRHPSYFVILSAGGPPLAAGVEGPAVSGVATNPSLADC